jgi:phage-related protein
VTAISKELRFGLNQNPKVWDLTWTAKTTADADAIEAFFDARGGQESFDWAPLDDATLIQMGGSKLDANV